MVHKKRSLQADIKLNFLGGKLLLCPCDLQLTQSLLYPTQQFHFVVEFVIYFLFRQWTNLR